MLIKFKRVMILFIVIAMLLVVATPIYASSITLEGQIVQGRFLVPMRGIFEALGATVHWDGDTRTVTGNRAGTTVLLSIDSTRAKVNDSTFELDVPATIVESRTYVPLRFISESLGANVSWDGETRVATITQEGVVIRVREKLELPDTKTIVESYEGIDYQYEYNLYKSHLGYIIYIREGYQVIQEDGSDRIVFVFEGEPQEDEYILIGREESDPEEISQYILSLIQLSTIKYDDVVYERISYPIEGTYISGFSFAEWQYDGFYVVNNPYGGCFVIYNNWREEGAGRQMLNNMLSEFMIIE